MILVNERVRFVLLQPIQLYLLHCTASNFDREIYNLSIVNTFELVQSGCN